MVPPCAPFRDSHIAVRRPSMLRGADRRCARAQRLAFNTTKSAAVICGAIVSAQNAGGCGRRTRDDLSKGAGDRARSKSGMPCRRGFDCALRSEQLSLKHTKTLDFGPASHKNHLLFSGLGRPRYRLAKNRGACRDDPRPQFTRRTSERALEDAPMSMRVTSIRGERRVCAKHPRRRDDARQADDTQHVAGGVSAAAVNRRVRRAM